MDSAVVGCTVMKLNDPDPFNLLDVVRGVDGIHAGIRHRCHVEHRADDIRFVGRVNIEPDFLPFAPLEYRWQRGTVATIVTLTPI